MILNTRLINTFSSNDYYELIKSGKYRSLLSARNSRNDPDIKTSCQDLAKIDALEMFLCKELLSGQPVEKNLIIEYRDYIFELLKMNKEMVFVSYLFDKEIVDKLFTTSQIEYIKAIKTNISKETEAIYKKLKSKSPLSKDEKDLFLSFVIRKIPDALEASTIDTNINLAKRENRSNPYDKKIREKIKYLEERKKKIDSMTEILDDTMRVILENPQNLSLHAKEFVLKYTAYISAKYLQMPAPNVYIADIDLNGANVSENTNGLNHDNSGVILCNKRKLIKDVSPVPNIPCIAKFEQVVAHETKHSKQAYDTYNGIKSPEAFEYSRFLIFSKYLTTENFNEYKTNYSHSEIECDSNKFGWLIASRILKKYAPELGLETHTTTEEIMSQYRNSLSNKRYPGHRLPKEYYNVERMDEIVLNHPDVLNAFPILKPIYHSNGKRRGFIEILNNASKPENKDIDEQILDYIRVDLRTINLEDVNLSLLNFDELFNFFCGLNKICLTDITLLKRSTIILCEENRFVYEHINKDRLERIIKIINYFEKEKVLINNLIEIDVQHQNARVFGMQMRYLDEFIKSLKRHLKEALIKLKETNLYEEAKSFIEGDYHGPHY